MRGKIGLLVPSSNTTMEYDFNKNVPEGVSVHTARLEGISGIEHNELYSMSYQKASEIIFPTAKIAARSVSSAGMNVIIYGTTSFSHIKGNIWNQDLTNQLEQTTNVKTVTASTAVEEGLREMSIKRLVLVTPYTEKTTRNEKKWLESRGFEVIKMAMHKVKDPTNNLEIASILPEHLYFTIRAAFRSDADGVLLSCTNLRTIEIIEKLEKDLGKYVISSNQACIWAGLKVLDMKKAVKGCGNLLKRL